MREPRPLDPAHLHVVGDELWVVDAVQPVAAVLDPATGALRRLVGWPDVPAWHEASDPEWRTLSDGDALWVQSGSGPPARVAPDGAVVVATVRTTATPERWRLAAAGPGGAWLVGQGPVQDIAASPDAPPPADGGSRLLVAARDGDVREVVVQHPVHDVLGTAEGVLVQVDTGRGRRIDLDLGSWSWEPDHEWLSVPWSHGMPEVVSVRSHATVPAPLVPSARLPGWPFLWHGTDEGDAAGAGATRHDIAGGLRWLLGWDRSGSTPRRSVATGHDPGDGGERLRVPLGRGTVRALVGTASALFVAVLRPGGQAAVLVVDPASGDVRETAASAVDVSAHRRPLGPPPADLGSYTRYWLSRWAGESGTVEPAEEGMANGRAAIVGDWPDTALEITFDWDRRPGLRLRRRLRLFDELGRHTPPEYSDVHLMEDLATDHVPPSGDAVGGVLDV